MIEAPSEGSANRPRAGLEAFRSLHEVAVAAAGLRDPFAVARVAVDHVQRLVSVEGAVVFAWDEDLGLLVPLDESPSSVPESPCRRGEGAVGTAFEEGRAVTVEDYQSWDRALPAARDRGMVAGVAVPLVAEGRSIGALGVWTCRPRTFDTIEVELLSLLAAQVAPALDAAHLVQERERQASVFRALHEVSIAASGVLDPRALGDLTVARAGELLGVDGVAVFWLDEPSGRLRLLAHHGEAEFGDGTADPRAGAVGRCFTSRAPVVIDDYPDWEGAIESGTRLGLASGTAVPLLAHDRVVGVLLAWSLAPRRFRPSELELLSLLAAQMAPAVAAARLVEDRERHSRGMRLLNEVAMAASGVLEPAALARLAVDRAQELTRADSASLAWLDEESGVLQVIADNHPQARVGRPVPTDRGALGTSFRDRRPVVVEDYASWEHAIGWAVAIGDASVMAVPLMVRDRAVGSLGLQSWTRRGFGAELVQQVSLLASLVAPALQAARLHTVLAASEQQLRSLYESIACGVLVQSPAGVVLHANVAAEDILGLALDQMRARSTDLLWGATDESGRQLAMDQRPAVVAAMTRRPVRGFSLRIERKDGERRWLQVDSVPLLGSDGSPVQVVSSFIDVTLRREAEGALRASEGRFRAVFDGSAMGIARLDLEGRVIEANPAFQRLVGYSEREIEGRRFGDFLEDDDVDFHRLAELAQGGLEQSQVEIRYRRRDGVLVWGNSLASLVRDERGRPLFIVAMVEDVGGRKAQEAALEHQALHDALTDLPNRTLLHDRLRQALLSAQREGGSVALLLMDIDRFKEVNDTFGHQLGDLLLQQVASRLRGGLRESDTVARLGGDEFAMILPGIDDEPAAARAAGKIMTSLDEPFLLDPEILHVGGSIGIALHPRHGADVETLMRRADIAMYVAKRSGTGFALYSSEDDTTSPSRVALLRELRLAVERDELLLYYQPKVDLRSGRTAGLEALLRWDHPRHGLMLPDQFIPLAEDTGLTTVLGLWVVEAALGQCQRWAQEGIHLPVAVNISPRSLQDAQLAETIGWLLKSQQVPAERLRVEVTESTLMADPERAMEVLTVLAEMGVGITIDDFGTGYSSLAYLGRLPADELKIARQFVMEMSTVDSARVIVRSIIDLGHSLGLTVVGEGVENQRSRDELAASACDMAQGFHLGRPLPAADLGAWLAGRGEEAGP
ncbi:MAG: EAL domain-containing protein [Candidatus Dormibacteraceae bacterium]